MNCGGQIIYWYSWSKHYTWGNLFLLSKISVTFKSVKVIFVHVFPGPAGCDGSVSCTVRSNAKNGAMSDVTVTLNNIPSPHQCIESYNFSLAGKVKKVYVSDTVPSATFTIERELGELYLDQTISTYDKEEREGSSHCSFSITSEYISSVLWLWQMITTMLLVVLF